MLNVQLNVPPRGLLKDNYELVLDTFVPDSTANKMIVGEKYEFYAPAAKDAAKHVGIIWGDDVGFSFIYAGTVELQGVVTICTPDIRYSSVVIGVRAQVGSEQLAAMLGGNHPLCPSYIARQFIRPVTDA